MKNFMTRLLTKVSILAIAFGSLFAVSPAMAAQMDTRSDTMTRQQISTTADHSIVYTLPTSIDFDVTGNTDVLIHDFPAGFTQGGTWATTDFTFNDGTARTIDAVSAGAGTATVSCTDGANTVGVAIDTTAIAFRVIPCGASFTAQGAASTVTFTIAGTTAGGTLTNPSSAGANTLAITMDDEGASAAHTGSLVVPIMDSDQVTVTATVAETMTFDLDVTTADGDTSTETAAAYSVALGTITTTDTRSSGTTDSANHIYLDLDTNASNGAVVQVKSANGTNGLVSTSVSGDNINSADGTMADGTENYGICVVDATIGTTNLTEVAPFNDATCATNSEVNVVGGVTTSFASILSATAAVDSARAQIAVSAAISTTTVAHDDYTDTLTFRATATF